MSHSRLPLPQKRPIAPNGTILEALWKLEPTSKEIDSAVIEVTKPRAIATTRLMRQSFADPVRLWLRLTEEFAAVQPVDYLEGSFGTCGSLPSSCCYRSF